MTGVNIRRGVKAGIAVALLMVFLNSFFIFISDPSLSNAWYVPVFFVLSAIVWLPSGLLFAALYDKIPLKRYKSAIFSVVPISILFLLLLYPIVEFFNLAGLATFFIAFSLKKLFSIFTSPSGSPEPLLFYISIIIYGIIGALLLSYFWGKFAAQGKAKK